MARFTDGTPLSLSGGNMLRKIFVCACASFVLLAVGIVWQASLSEVASGDAGPAAREDKKPLQTPLPIKHVVLFNSGVGYFQRDGEVAGKARIQLAFPAADINDLLKSLILQDLGGGRISSVNYDSQDPIDKVLHSFALDLNNNPTYGQILNQARGEKIEVLRVEKKDTPAAKVLGTIVGMQLQSSGKGQAPEVEFLNLMTAQGLESVPLAQVLAVRFLNPALESEFQRALKVLAASHDSRKKTVSLGFNGKGKRQVRVGYVVEQPIWKTTYRLRLEAKGKLYLQGWALVENTSDEDWNDVHMALISGRPISYKMDLYEPLYIPRPAVEPELFASLRPPVYAASLIAEETAKLPAPPAPFGSFLGGGLANGGRIGGGMINNMMGGMAMMGGGMMGMMGMGGMPLGMGGMNMMGSGLGGMIGGQYLGSGQLGGPFGAFNQPGAWKYYQGNPYQYLSPSMDRPQRLTYEELQKRRQEQRAAREKARKVGSAVAGLNFKEGIASVANATEVGDYYRYVLDQKITLPRQKSAMLPILDQTIAGTKVSIFNEAVHPRYPLLGLRLKNTSGQPLTQGPITVFEDGSYAGDTRILDLQPNEVRFLSYALDQGTEIKVQTKTSQSPEMTLKINDNALHSFFKNRETRTYAIKNRSPHGRVLIVEHPIRSGWDLIAPQKPAERTRDVYRFQVKVPAGQLVSLPVIEEQDQVVPVALSSENKRFVLPGGLEVEPVRKFVLGERMELKIVKNVLHARHKVRESLTYFIHNHSGQDRVFQVDHLVRPDWQLADGKKNGKGPHFFHFTLPVAAGKSASRQVVEEQTAVRQYALTIQEDQPACYVLGLGIEVRPFAKETPKKLTELKIVNGILKSRHQVRQDTTIFVKNNADRERLFVFDHVVRPGWKRLDPNGDVQPGPGVYRFELKLPPGKTAYQEIVEERTYSGMDRPIKEVADAELQKFLTSRVPSADVKLALGKMRSMRAKLAEVQSQLADAKRQLRDVSDDQSRLRANLAIIPQGAEPYKKFLQKFVTQEQEIETLQRRVRQLQASARKQQTEYESYVSSLNAE